MDFFKIKYILNQENLTTYVLIDDLILLNFNHPKRHLKLKFKDFEISGYVKYFDLSDFELYLLVRNEAYFDIELFEEQQDARIIKTVEDANNLLKLYE